METDDPSYVCAVNLSDDDDVDEPQVVYQDEGIKHGIKKQKVEYQPEAVSSASTANLVRPVLPKPVAPPSTVDFNPRIHNVVASVDLGCKLDLTKIALAARNADYNPKRFGAIVMRIHEPRTVILIFKTGKIVITGGKNEAAAHLAARKCGRIIQKLGNNVKFINFKVQNIVASCDVRFPIHIESIYRNQVQFCSYEPELFPGLIYRMVQPKVVLLIFVTGKMVLVGAKSRKQLSDACEFIYPVLRSHRKQ